MKKTFSFVPAILLWSVLFVYGADEFPGAVSSSAEVFCRVYEAEEATLLDAIAIGNDASASGGKFLRMGESGGVRFQVFVEKPGRYAVGIRYRTDGGGKAQRLLINDRPYAPEIGFPGCAEWNEMETRAGLRAGANTIEVRKSWGHMDLDSMTIRGPVFERPEITPVSNIYYLEQSQSDLFIQVEKKQNEFLSIMQDQKPVPFAQEEVSYLQDAIRVRIGRDFLETLEAGTRELAFCFRDTQPVRFRLEIREAVPKAALCIVSFDVSHGASVLIVLPTGKTLLVDTGKESMCKERVLPFLERHRITPDTLWITHYHEDHCGGEGLLTEKFSGLVKKDYRDFKTEDTFEFEGVEVTILNSYADGQCENSRSLAFRMEYKGFIYLHDGDIYGQNQQRILRRYYARNKAPLPEADVYHANHHFHGSVDVPYLRTINPFLILVSAEEHVYGRGAYTYDVQRQVYPYLRESGRLIEDLLSFETGHAVIRVIDGDTWSYETYKDLDAVIAGLAR